ncbi:hypothetical protein CRM22_007633 [Opisthorchis felineus]|uniref:SAM domain-containing protein n=1 Tax=Opisthorchis felineus TaxID=147828 RepID=A0A4S2LLT7_OPIFE|nr:hypothetical protein CRM22_007633 [Opisthorchis felineus]
MYILLLAFICFVIPTGTSEICDLTDDLTTCYKKFLSFEGIGNIHKQIDGDNNGHVDSSEAASFVRKEFSPADSAQNPRSLTKEDPYVSLSDLWAMWRRNPAFGWSVKQTVQWLCDVVHLPQYSDIFVRHSVDGKTLPLLAMQNMSYLTDVLMIRNPIDKRKLMLKALDAILFGSPTKPQLLPSPMTTAVFGIMSLVIFGLSHWFYTRLSDAKSGPNSGSPAFNERTLKELQSRLDDLEQLQYRLNSREQGAQFSSLHSQLPMSPSWSELPKFRSRSSASKPWAMLPIDSGSPPKFYSERVQTRQELEKRTSTGEETNRPPSTDFDRNETNPTLLDPDFPRVTSRTSITDFDGCSSIALQLWLQLTYALEEEQYLNRKTQAELNLNSARQACSRLHRKRFNVLGPVRLLYSDSLGELEFKLMQAKCDLEHLERELQERTQRWIQIESLTGMQIRNHPNIEKIRKSLVSLQQPELDLPDTKPPSSSSIVSFELGPPTTTDSAFMEQSHDPLHNRMSIPDVVNLVLESRGGSRSALYGKMHSSNKASTSDSSVRPFATLWRRKAGFRMESNTPKQP